MLEKTRESLHLAHEAGVKFLLGTDAGFAITPYGEWHAKEMELLMQYAGMTELEAIQAGTSNGSRVLNLEGEVGAIAPGMLADVLIVNGDPSTDITVLQDPEAIETILVGGEIAAVDRTVESWKNQGVMRFADTYITRDLVRRAHEGGGP